VRCAPAERGGRQVLTPRAAAAATAAAATGPVGVWAASQQHPTRVSPTLAGATALAAAR